MSSFEATRGTGSNGSPRGLFQGTICGILLLAAGCVDGPMFALKKFNPVFQSQWKEDAEKGTVFVERQQEIRRLRGLMSGMPEDEQAKWITSLAKVYDYETSPELRRDSVMAIAESKHPTADEVLLRACSDKHDKVRLSAANALAGRNSAGAQQMLQKLAVSDKTMSVRLAAIRSLGTSDTPEARGILRRSLDEKSPAIQYEATLALKAMTGRDLGGNVDAWREFMDGGTTQGNVANIADVSKAPANNLQR